MLEPRSLEVGAFSYVKSLSVQRCSQGLNYHAMQHSCGARLDQGHARSAMPAMHGPAIWAWAHFSMSSPWDNVVSYAALTAAFALATTGIENLQPNKGQV
jgi:hypothetical protein